MAAEPVEPESFEQETMGISSRNAPHHQTSEQNFDEENEDSPHQKERSSGGFFSRMAKVATRPFQSDRKSQKAEQEFEMAEPSQSSHTPSRPIQDDLLDIPAFLRRK
jgi:hypothetical protein